MTTEDGGLEGVFGSSDILLVCLGGCGFCVVPLWIL